MKKCSCCQEHKEINEFYGCKRAKDGLKTACKKCHGKQRNRDAKKEYNLYEKDKRDKVQKTDEYLGCTYEEGRNYLASLFTEGMTWDNHGEWHIDHIIPLASAKTREELEPLFHYTNLQPLWAEDNLKKGAKIPKA